MRDSCGNLKMAWMAVKTAGNFVRDYKDLWYVKKKIACLGLMHAEVFKCFYNLL